MPNIDIVLDGPDHPDRNAPTYEFVELENAEGKSIRLGEWVIRDDGFTALRLPDPRPLIELIEAIDQALNKPIDMTQVLDTPAGRALWGAHQAGIARSLIQQFKEAQK